MKITRLVIASLALLAMGAPAVAQIATGNEFVTATPGKNVTGVMIGCWDGAKWTPATTSGTCSGGGGGGGAATIANGADVAEGSTGDAAYAGSGAGTTISILKGLYAGQSGLATQATLASILSGQATQTTLAAVLANQTNNTQTVIASGNVASGATDAGNPVKIGGVFNTTPPTLATGQRGDLQIGATGSLLVAAANTVTGADGISNALGATINSQAGPGRYLMVWPMSWNGTTWARTMSDTSTPGAALTVSKGNGNLVTAQVAVGTTATATVAARALRSAVTVTNITGTQPIFCTSGTGTATLVNGQFIAGVPGAQFTFPYNGILSCIAQTAAQTVSVTETY